MSTLTAPAFNTLNNPEFYARRAEQARELAANAKEASVRAIHLKMAEEYAAKVDGTSTERSALGIVRG